MPTFFLGRSLLPRVAHQPTGEDTEIDLQAERVVDGLPLPSPCLNPACGRNQVDQAFQPDERVGQSLYVELTVRWWHQKQFQVWLPGFVTDDNNKAVRSRNEAMEKAIYSVFSDIGAVKGTEGRRTVRQGQTARDP